MSLHKPSTEPSAEETRPVLTMQTAPTAHLPNLTLLVM